MTEAGGELSSQLTLLTTECRRRSLRLGIEYDNLEELTDARLQVRVKDRDDWADCDLIASVPFGEGQASLVGAAVWLRLYLRRLAKQEEAT